LGPGGRRAGGELDAVAVAAELGAPPDVAAIELLRTLAEALGLLRARGTQLEATPLWLAWSRIDRGLRAGLCMPPGASK
jgi:hypothetical protein